jgi:hypothetical protein
VRTVACLQSWMMFTLKVTKLGSLKEVWQHHHELNAEVARVASQREQIAILEERDEYEGIPPYSSSSC